MRFGKILALLMLGSSLLLPTKLEAQEYDSLKTVQVANDLISRGFSLDGYIIGKPSEIQVDYNNTSKIINCPLVAEKQYNSALMSYPLFVAFNKNDSTSRANRDFINNYGGIGFILDDNNVSPQAYAYSIKKLLNPLTSVEGPKNGKVLENMFYEIYPNPSNGVVNIKYELERNSDVTFGLYDILGRQVKSFSEKNLPGEYRREFNTSDLPSGIYFIQIIADSDKNRFIQTKKISVIK